MRICRRAIGRGHIGDVDGRRRLHVDDYTPTTVKTTKTCSTRGMRCVSEFVPFLSTVAVGGVFSVQLESNGDPWSNYSNVDAEDMRYFWDYFYFVLIMLTTIGFGDIYPNTTLGKLFLVFYVLLCLVNSRVSSSKFRLHTAVSYQHVELSD